MSSPICSPDRADLGQDGNSAQSETLKQCGQDGDPKTKSWDGYCISKKSKRKGTLDKDPLILMKMIVLQKKRAKWTM